MFTRGWRLLQLTNFFSSTSPHVTTPRSECSNSRCVSTMAAAISATAYGAEMGYCEVVELINEIIEFL